MFDPVRILSSLVVASFNLILTIPRVLFASLQCSATTILTICRTNVNFNLFGVHPVWKTYQSTSRVCKPQQGQSQETAAAKAAISERSGRRIERVSDNRFQENIIGVLAKIL